MATALLTALADVFQDDLVPGIKDIVARNDPIFENIIEDRMRTSYNNIDGSYTVTTTVCTSLGGGLTFAGIAGNPTIWTDGTTRPIINESFETFPGIQDSTMPGLDRYSITLTKMKGNLQMPFAILRANELNAAIGDYPALIMQKHIQYLGHVLACSFYVDTNATLVKINTNGAAGVVVRSTDNLVALTTDTGRLFDAGRSRRIKPGLFVDIWKEDMSECYNPTGNVVVVGAFDYENPTGTGASTSSTLTLYWSNVAELTAWAGAIGAGSTIPDNCKICVKDAIRDKTADGTALSVMPCGYQHWAIGSGTLYGAFGNKTVGVLPELKSIVRATVGDVSETVLNAHLTLFFEALDGDVDTFLTTAGVMTNILDQPVAAGLMSYARQGDALDLNMGWKGLKYTYDGREYKFLASPYMTTGHLLACKTRDGNLRRYLPPKIPGMGTQPGYDPAVEWIGKYFGSTIWLPTHSTDRVAEGAQAPHMIVLQHAAMDPRSLLLTGCTETTV